MPENLYHSRARLAKPPGGSVIPRYKAAPLRAKIPS